ncbi:Sulfotransferase family protein [Streptomyces sp. DvalAA-14]|uniref:sulfotransferase n=1 Tax=unclassified Streptomyces TaxID=2593676 RepID=UPI00081B1D13|nr:MULTISPECIES: sulfotransferase [unclassified Streptomyces]MYS21693.1 sulfotransferase [Streptomyces sp. SID4948]SCD99035.1 Sulfotransferase family protein [Streptomyces sp. DvalAA-14]
MRHLTFIVGTGRSGSTALSGILNMHPDVLSLNEFMASVGSSALPDGALTGEEFWRLLAEPNPRFETMIRSGYPMPEFLYTRRPGRFATRATGIPALALMVLPHLTDDPDSLYDELEAQVTGWPHRTAPEHHEALFRTLCARFGRSVVVERSGYSAHRVPLLRAAFPHARFVHLFRDGPDCAVSMSRHPGYRIIYLLRDILARTGATDVTGLTADQIRSLPPELAALLTDRFDAAAVRDRPIPVHEFGALWSQLVTDATVLLHEVPAQLRTTLAYEDLLGAPRRELARLAAFIGVEPLPTWLDTGGQALDSSRVGISRRLSSGELTALRERCAPGERALKSRCPNPAT